MKRKFENARNSFFYLIETFFSTIYQRYTLNICYVIKAWLILVSCKDRKM